MDSKKTPSDSALQAYLRVDEIAILLRSIICRMMMFLLILTLIAQTRATRQDSNTNCTFPARWEGSWFLSGYQQSIHVKGSQFSYRGKCAASEGNKYLIIDEKGCHRCLVIYEKHKNVLQYKESECEGDSMYLHQTNPSAMAMRSVLKQGGDHSRGGAHPNSNGHSRVSSSDQFILRSNDDESDYFCKGRETLQNLCDQIPGDALLFSLFREGAEPVKCPLKGPFIFTYNRGHGECRSPVSNIESCTEDSRLLLSFQACPDVQGTESTVEELTCLATWKDGNSRYLVGLVSHHHAISNEERYRCFVYEKLSSLLGGPGLMNFKDAEYKLAQSGDATCNGLDSAEVGSRIMSLRKPPPAERCDFPAWFKGPKHWHALMGNAVYNYHSNEGSMHIIKPNGYMETRAFCEQINKQTSTEVMAVAHYTTGCQSGFMCIIFYRRDTHVIELQMGKGASRLEEACAQDHFDVKTVPYVTLLANNPDPQICPLEGLYNLQGFIGPPHATSRHKRNHNKAYVNQEHSHMLQTLSDSEALTSISRNGKRPHERKKQKSYQTLEGNKHHSWHSHTRGHLLRDRRSVNKALSQIGNRPKYNNSSEKLIEGYKGVTRNHRRMKYMKKIKIPNVIDPNHENNSKTKEYQKYLIKREPKNYKEISNKEMFIQGNPSPFGVDEKIAHFQNDSALVTLVPIQMKKALIIKSRTPRDIPNCVVNYKAKRQLLIGCTAPNLIDVRPLCSVEGDEEYSCHGSWSENGTVFLIARHKGTKHGVCVSYRKTEGTTGKLVVGDACYRGRMELPSTHLVANLTLLGKCGDTNAVQSWTNSYGVTSNWLSVIVVAFVVQILNCSFKNAFFLPISTR